MERMEIEKVARIRLAGAFGSHIDVKYAMVIGLIPDCNLDNVSSAGNAAGTGARIALLNYKKRKEIEDIVKKVEKIETAVEKNFQVHFVNAMAFPNKIDSFQNLSKVVSLPEVNNTKNISTTKRLKNKRRRKRR